jgi:hypothetical protein
MRTQACLRVVGVAALACAALSSASASAQGTPVSREKNAELNRVAENQGNYDSPPVTRPSTFSHNGYSQCLTALGTTYCREASGPWHAI